MYSQCAASDLEAREEKLAQLAVPLLRQGCGIVAKAHVHPGARAICQCTARQGSEVGS